jgi:hypothetical protein
VPLPEQASPAADSATTATTAEKLLAGLDEHASAKELLAGLPEQPADRETVLIPAETVLVPTAAESTEDADIPSPDDSPVYLYGPLYGASYVPMPVLDRHRMRVKS